MRRSSLHGLAASLQGVNLNDLGFEGSGEASPSDNSDGTTSPAPSRSRGVNSLAIAAARSKRRVRRATPDKTANATATTTSRSSRKPQVRFAIKNTNQLYVLSCEDVAPFCLALENELF